MARITMQEIARRAKVSLATVSRTIHSPHLVQQETRERVLRVMEEQHYVYNAVAGDLSRRRSSVLGLIIPTVTLSIFASSVAGVQEYAHEHGYSVIIGNTNYESATERRLLAIFQQRRVAGVILTGMPSGSARILADLETEGIPAVVTWETPKCPGLNHVGFDNRKASRSMTEYLLSLGHRRIGLVVGPFSRIERVQERHAGYRDALEAHGLSYDPSLVVESRSYSLLNGEEAMTRLLGANPLPTAVFAASDVLAMGVLRTLRVRGYRVPEDISLAGFDDVDFAAYCEPPLTTVRVPGHEMGRLAAEVLLERIENGNAPVRQYALDTDLIIRESCRRFG